MSTVEGKSVTVRVPMNIALIKYWGKRDEELILPLNDSLSVTVDELYATTTVELVAGESSKNEVHLNGKKLDLGTNKRYNQVFTEVQRLMRKRKIEEGDGISTHYFKVNSTTNFPVAAGLASSAAGFAAIAFGIKHLLNLDDATANRLARIGSGSACRSMLGGLARWHSGVQPDGSDSVAKQVSTELWSSLRCLIFVFDGEEKKVGSTEGMRRSAETSELLKYRISNVMPKRAEKIETAFKSRDFDSLAELIMRDSNEFHAICLDSFPPIKYLSDASWKLIETVNEFNSTLTNSNGNAVKVKSYRAAYTFDAGPNAVVFLEENTVADFLEHLSHIISLPLEDVSSIMSGLGKEAVEKVPHELPVKATRVIYSKIGSPPVVVE